MTLDTYANLQTEVLAALVRTADTDAIARCPTWITLAETEIRTQLNKLKVRFGETKDAALSIASEYTSLPSGYYAFRTAPLLTSVSPYVKLDYVAPKTADEWDPNASAACPKIFTVQGNQLRVFPPPDATYTATQTYYALTSLSVSNTSNWLLTNYPKVYYVAVLAEAALYYGQFDKYQAGISEIARIIDGINTADSSDQQAVNPKIRLGSSTP